MDSDPNKLFLGGRRKSRPSRRSSILKSPTRAALAKLDANYLAQSEPTVSLGATSVARRRVSFAKTFQVKEFVKEHQAAEHLPNEPAPNVLRPQQHDHDDENVIAAQQVVISTPTVNAWEQETKVDAKGFLQKLQLTANSTATDNRTSKIDTKNFLEKLQTGNTGSSFMDREENLQVPPAEKTCLIDKDMDLTRALSPNSPGLTKVDGLAFLSKLQGMKTLSTEQDNNIEVTGIFPFAESKSKLTEMQNSVDIVGSADMDLTGCLTTNLEHHHGTSVNYPLSVPQSLQSVSHGSLLGPQQTPIVSGDQTLVFNNKEQDMDMTKCVDLPLSTKVLKSMTSSKEETIVFNFKSGDGGHADKTLIFDTKQDCDMDVTRCVNRKLSTGYRPHRAADKTLVFSSDQGNDMDVTKCVDSALSSSPHPLTADDKTVVFSSDMDVTKCVDSALSSSHRLVTAADKTLVFSSEQGNSMDVTKCVGSTLSSSHPPVTAADKTLVFSSDMDVTKCVDSTVSGNHHPVTAADKTLVFSSDMDVTKCVDSTVSSSLPLVTAADKTLVLSSDMDVTKCVDFTLPSSHRSVTLTAADKTLVFSSDIDVTKCVDPTLSSSHRPVTAADKTLVFSSEQGNCMDVTKCVGSTLSSSHPPVTAPDKTLVFSSDMDVTKCVDSTVSGNHHPVTAADKTLVFSSDMDVTKCVDSTVSSSHPPVTAADKTVVFSNAQGSDMDVTRCVDHTLSSGHPPVTAADKTLVFSSDMDVTKCVDSTVSGNHHPVTAADKTLVFSSDMDVTKCVDSTVSSSLPLVTAADKTLVLSSDMDVTKCVDFTLPSSHRPVTAADKTLVFSSEQGNCMDVTKCVGSTLSSSHPPVTAPDKTLVFSSDMDVTKCVDSTVSGNHHPVTAADKTLVFSSDMDVTKCVDSTVSSSHRPVKAADKTLVFSSDMDVTKCIDSALSSSHPPVTAADKTVVFSNAQGSDMDVTRCVDHTLSSGLLTVKPTNKTLVFGKDPSSDMDVTKCLDSTALSHSCHPPAAVDKTVVFSNDQGSDMDVTKCVGSSALSHSGHLPVTAADKTVVFSSDMDVTKCVDRTVSSGAHLSVTAVDKTVVFSNDQGNDMDVTKCVDRTLSSGHFPVKAADSDKTVVFSNDLGNDMNVTRCLDDEKREKENEKNTKQTKVVSLEEPSIPLNVSKKNPLASLRRRVSMHLQQHDTKPSDSSFGAGCGAPVKRKESGSCFSDEDSDSVQEPTTKKTRVIDESEAANLADGQLANETETYEQEPGIMEELSLDLIGQSDEETDNCAAAAAELATSKKDKRFNSPCFSQSVLSNTSTLQSKTALSLVEMSNLSAYPEGQASPLESFLSRMNVFFFDDYTHLRRSTIAGTSMKPAESLSEWLQLATMQPQVDLYLQFLEQIKLLKEECNEKNTEISQNLSSIISNLYKDDDEAETRKQMQSALAVSRRKSKTHFKELRGKMIATMLAIHLDEIGQIKGMKEELLERDHSVQEALAAWPQVEVNSSANRDRVQKMKEQIAQLHTQLNEKEEALEQTHQQKVKLSQELKSLKQEAEKIQHQSATVQMQFDNQASISGKVEEYSKWTNTLQDVVPFTIETKETKGIEFHFLDECLELRVGLSQPLVKTLSSEKPVKLNKLELLFGSSDASDPEMRLVSQCIEKRCELLGSLLHQCTDTAQLPSLLQQLSHTVCECRQLFNDIDALNLRHKVSICDNQIRITVSNLEAFVKFEVTFTIDTETFPHKKVEWSFKSIIGSLQEEDLREILDSVKPGFSYLRRLMNGVDKIVKGRAEAVP